ncbi:MAG: pentapeptide repeat-containing protein [Pseudomonadota bacterium]
MSDERSDNSLRARVKATEVAALSAIRDGGVKAIEAHRRLLGATPIWFTAIMIIIVPFWLWLMVEAITEVWTITSGRPQTGDTKEIAEINRNRVQSIFFSIGIIGALLAAIIVPVRLWLQNRQTLTAEQRQLTTEQGHITDRLNAAIRMLGEEKTQKRTETFRVRSIEYDLPAGEDSHTVEVNQRAGEDLQIPPDAKNVKYGDWETSTNTTEETVPNLEVRLGAIYALERIAQDSERDHITVMEVLCAYLRTNAPASMAQDHDLGEWPDWIEDATEEQREERNAEILERIGGVRGRKYVVGKLREWVDTLPKPRVDIQAAITVIGRRDRIDYERRPRRNFRLDLRNTCLQQADLSYLSLSHALLTGARLEGADFDRAELDGADLHRAQLEGAGLEFARLDRANLSGARMEKANLAFARLGHVSLQHTRLEAANLTGARMETANCMGVRLEGADLSAALMEGAILRWAKIDGGYIRSTRLEGADLREARMEGVDLYEANLKSADLTHCTFPRTRVRSADFTEAKNLEQDAVNAAFGDITTKLPGGLAMPDHWDDQKFKGYPDEKYDAWIAAGAPPGKVREGEET